MKGYKVLDKDMRAKYGNGMQFELGKTYSVKGNVILCKNGFHFCDKIENLNMCYDIVESRIFEIEAEGDIINSDNKYAARSITLIRELTKEEISSYFKQNVQTLVRSADCYVRLAVAEQGYGLGELIYDKNYVIRCAVVGHRYGLDILLYDEYCLVRKAVAEQGYGLDKLINDKDWSVRRAVAKQSYGLDKLIYDKNSRVRIAVAEQGYGLDILIKDESCFVRAAVAEQGYGLDILIKDECQLVRVIAEEAYRKMQTGK